MRTLLLHGTSPKGQGLFCHPQQDWTCTGERMGHTSRGDILYEGQ